MIGCVIFDQSGKKCQNRKKNVKWLNILTWAWAILLTLCEYLFHRFDLVHVKFCVDRRVMLQELQFWCVIILFWPPCIFIVLGCIHTFHSFFAVQLFLLVFYPDKKLWQPKWNTSKKSWTPKNWKVECTHIKSYIESWLSWT